MTFTQTVPVLLLCLQSRPEKSKFGSGDPSFQGRKGLRIQDIEGSFVG